MAKVLVVVSALMALSGVALAEDQCDKRCELGKQLVEGAARVDNMGIKTSEVSYADGEMFVRVLAYSENADAMYRQLMSDPLKHELAKQMTAQDVGKGVCESELFREFLAAGGSVRHEIRLQRDGLVFYDNVITACPRA